MEVGIFDGCTGYIVRNKEESVDKELWIQRFHWSFFRRQKSIS